MMIQEKAINDEQQNSIEMVVIFAALFDHKTWFNAYKEHDFDLICC